MCLIVFAYRRHPDYPLILAGNRDEFYERSTRPAHFWEDEPAILGGRDLKYGGTWMGITRSGRFATVTNFREAGSKREHAMSRGLMVRDYLAGSESPAGYLEIIKARKDRYNGFNLILGDRDTFLYYSNRKDSVEEIEPGIHALSNHLLDTPWPKVVRSRRSLQRILDRSPKVDVKDLLEILSDRRIARDDQLPDTGFGLEWERILSPPFITSETYGTRASSALLVDAGGQVTLVERSFDGPGVSGLEARYQFTMEPTR